MMLSNCMNRYSEEILTIATQSSLDDPIVPCVKLDRTLPSASTKKSYHTILRIQSKQPLPLNRSRFELSQHCTSLPRIDRAVAPNVEGPTDTRIVNDEHHPCWLDYLQASTHDKSLSWRKETPVTTSTYSSGEELPCVACIVNHSGHAYHERTDRCIQHDHLYVMHPSKHSPQSCNTVDQSNVCQVSASATTIEDALIGSDPSTGICENPRSEPWRNGDIPPRTISQVRLCRKKRHYYRRRHPIKVRQLHRRHKRRNSDVISDNCCLVLAAFLFCLPLGVISLYYTYQVNHALSNNETEEARIYSLKGRKFASTGVKMGIMSISFAILLLIMKDEVSYSTLEYRIISELLGWTHPE